MRAAAAMLLATVVTSGCDDGGLDTPAIRDFALWSEFLADDEVRAQIPFLQAERADLYLAIPSRRIGEPTLAALLRDLADAGVGVRAWVLLPEEEGYWPNEHNVAAMREATLSFADWREREGLPVDWVIFDLEMSLARTRAVAEQIETNGALAGLNAILDGEDPEAFAAHRDELAALVSELQGRGLRVMSVSYPTVLDDPGDADAEIQDRMDVPVLGLPWDEASFMVYQSLIHDLSGSWHGPDVIESYGRTALEQFGERASVALGIVGSAAIDPVAAPYPDEATLLRDQAAARAAGVPRVSVYSLDGILQQTDPGAWVDADRPAEVPAPGDAEDLRGLVRTLLDS